MKSYLQQLAWLVVTWGGVTACEKESTPVQAYPQAIRQLCDAELRSAQEKRHLADWVAKNVLQPDVRDLFARIEAMDMGASAALRTAALEAGITRCLFVEPQWAAHTPAQASGAGVDRLGAELPLIVVSPTTVGLGRHPLVSLDDTSRELKDPDLVLPELTDALRALPKKPSRAVIAFDRGTRAALLMRVLAATRRTGIADLVLLADQAATPIGLPIVLPTGAYRDGSDVASPLRMVVQFGTSEMKVWSLSGLEGTYTKPKAVLPRTREGREALAAMLTQIVAQRLTPVRMDEDRALTIFLSFDLEAEELIDTMSYVRRTSSGMELFPEVRMATPFE